MGDQQDSVEMDVSMEGVSGVIDEEASVVSVVEGVSESSVGHLQDEEEILLEEGDEGASDGEEGEAMAEIELGCNFKFLVEKVIGADLRTAAWCPSMDLLALATIGASGSKKLGEAGLEDLELQSSLATHLWIQRAGSANTWQRLQTIPAADNVGGSLLTNLVWRPDGKALATGHVDGSLAIYSLENGDLLAHHQPIKKQEDGKRTITALCWAQETTPKDQQTQKEKVFEDKILLPLRPEDIEQNESLISQPLTILVTGDTSLRIDLRAFGMFSIGTFDLASALKLNLSSSSAHKIESIDLSANLSRLSLILSSPSPPSPFSSKKKRKVEVVILDTSLLFKYREELRALAIHSELINTLIDRLLLLLDSMRDKWKETRSMMWSKFSPLIKLLEQEGKTPDSMRGFASSTTRFGTHLSMSQQPLPTMQASQLHHQQSQQLLDNDSTMKEDLDSQSNSSMGLIEEEEEDVQEQRIPTRPDASVSERGPQLLGRGSEFGLGTGSEFGLGTGSEFGLGTGSEFGIGGGSEAGDPMSQSSESQSSQEPQTKPQVKSQKRNEKDSAGSAGTPPAADGPTHLEAKLIARELLRLLATGSASHALQLFLSQNLPPQGLSRLAKSVDSACYSIQQQIIDGLQPALDQLLARLSSLRGLALWKERFEPIGLEDTYVSDILCKVSVWKMQIETFLLSIEKARSDYRHFFDWLAKAQIKLDEEAAPPRKKPIFVDEIKVSEFLLRFESDPIAVYLSLLQPDLNLDTCSTPNAGPRATSSGLPSSVSTRHLTPTSIAPLGVSDLRQLLLGPKTSNRSGSLLSRMKRKKRNGTSSTSQQERDTQVGEEDGTGILAPASLHFISGEIRELANSSFNRPSETVGSTFKVCCRQPLFEHEEATETNSKQEEKEGERKAKGSAFFLNQPRLNQLVSFLSTPTAQYLAFRAPVPKEMDMDEMGMPIQREPDDPYAPCQSCIIILKTSSSSSSSKKDKQKEKDRYELSLIRLPSLITDVTQIAFHDHGLLGVLLSQKGSKARPPPSSSSSSSSPSQHNSILALLPCRAPGDEIEEEEEDEAEEGEAEKEEEQEEGQEEGGEGEEDPNSLTFMEFDTAQTRHQMLVEMALGVFLEDPPESLPDGTRCRVQFGNQGTGMAISGTRKVGFVSGGNTRKIVVYDLADEEDEEEGEEEGEAEGDMEA